jgi:putative transcriptional regulator
VKSAFDKIAAGARDAIAQLEGDEGRVRIVKPVDVKAIRAAAKMSQAEFARTYKLPIGTLRDWEQHRREPDTTARLYLSIIEKDPTTVRRLVAKVD